jgi:hypothetical protein
VVSGPKYSDEDNLRNVRREASRRFKNKEKGIFEWQNY